MNSQTAYNAAMKALDQLYLSRTGKPYATVLAHNSDRERIGVLKLRIYDEKLWFALSKLLQLPAGSDGPQNALNLGVCELSDAIVRAAHMHLLTPELENLRKAMAEQQGGSAYYEMDTNEKLPYGEEDLFAVIQRADRRFVWDKNSSLPPDLNTRSAYVIGQTFDREDDFWLRREVRRGNENLYSFGVTELFGRLCLHIQRLTKPVVAALYKHRKTIPDAAEHYGANSRAVEIQEVFRSCEWGKERLKAEISRLRGYSTGCYQISICIARYCASLLLIEDKPSLEFKVTEERQKFESNHPNALGDMQVIQNALYLNSEIITRDKGLQQMAADCGLKWVN